MTAIAHHPHRVARAVARVRTQLASVAEASLWSMDATETTTTLAEIASAKAQLAELEARILGHADSLDVARDVGADFIIKGLRAVSDFESEMHQAHMNLATSGVHTVFIPSATEHSFVASKLIREIARFGGDVSSMVPEPVAKRLDERFPR